MKSQIQEIPCPVCSTSIPFDPYKLLTGQKFVCPNCSSAISLANESRGTVQNAMEKFEEVKKNALNSKKNTKDHKW